MLARSTFFAYSALAVLAVSAGSCSASPQSVQAQASPAASALEFTGYVVDQAGVLSQEQRDFLTSQLRRFQRDTGHQLAVVTVVSLGGVDVTAFTIALAKRWGVGRKGFNDGIVLLVAPHDEKARITVGLGLEAQLPDAFCRDVMEREMMPHFAKGHVGLGVQAGVSAIISHLTRSNTSGG